MSEYKKESPLIRWECIEIEVLLPAVPESGLPSYEGSV